jgi:hypothetical protein
MLHWRHFFLAELEIRFLTRCVQAASRWVWSKLRAYSGFWFSLIAIFVVASRMCSGADTNGSVIHLLQGTDRTPFYSFLKDFGVDKDPENVFSLTNGILHITGQYYGYLATKETNFANYKLVAEFKWGGKTWPPRETNACDSGILVHCGGKDQVWPKSIEAQIIEGGTGDILVVNGAYLTVDGVTKGPQIARFDRPGRNPWQDEKGFRGPHEIEQPRGEWNRMEVLCDGDKVSITVNGHKTLEGVNASPRSGKILVQSEGAEIFFRRLDVYPLNQKVE